MNSSILVAVLLVVLLAVCGTGDAFLQDLLLQPHAMSPYRRAVYEAPQALPQAQAQPLYSGPGGYVNSRPIIYQWLPARPGSYEVGYSYSNNNNNPLMTFLQNPWFPWSNRQPQPLSSQQPLQQPQQQPLWSFLPWNNNNNNNNNGGHQPASNPVFSFLQNPAGILPWTNRPSSGVLYTTPVAPSVPAGQVVSEQHLAPAPSPSSPETMAEDGVVQHIPAQDMNAIRRVHLQHDDSVAVPCT